MIHYGLQLRFGGIKMNCLKSVQFNKEFGVSYLRSLAIILSLVSFIMFYLILSVFHGSHTVEDTGIFLFLIAIILLPLLHMTFHLLPLIILRKGTKFILCKKKRLFPVLTYSTNSYLTKRVSIIKALSPTILITIPTIVASFYFSNYYVFIALFASIHLGISLRDFIFIHHIIKAPKKALIEDDSEGFSVLLGDNK